MKTGHLFVFGLGYTGLYVAKVAQQKGWTVAGTCRSRSKARELRSVHGIDAFVLGELGCSQDWLLDHDGRDALSQSTHVLTTIPPVTGANGDPVVSRLREELSSSCAPSLRWAGYLSTTGVYGDHAGAWVDERSETRALPGTSAAGA